MNSIIITVFVALGLLFWFLRWKNEKKKDFRNLIEPEIEKHGFNYISTQYPGLFKVGPFKKFEIEIGKPQINNGTIQYERTYYRIVILRTKKNNTRKIWAKIETGWFKESSVQFNPKLSEIKK